MASFKGVFLILLVVYSGQVHSASLLERSYEYVMNWGKSLAPGFMSLIDCFADNDVWECTKSKAGGLLDGWDEDVQKQRSLWRDQADAEVSASGRQLSELPSRIGGEVETSLFSVADLIQHSIARSFAPKKHGGIDSITVTTSKKKKDKKKKRPAHVHVVEESEKTDEKEDKEKTVPKQSWVIGDNDSVENLQPRGFLESAWSFGEKTLDSMAEHAIASDNEEDGVEDKSSVDEQRGKKKKKKKAILKLLLLGAVLKAKIATLLQILSFKLQVKFLLIALAGLLINVARFWIDVKKQAPAQKVIYYEHAQHQHHYDHEEEAGGWGGPWSRSLEPENEEGDAIPVELNSPYRAQERYPGNLIGAAPSRY